jgi:hypothetical protein
MGRIIYTRDMCSACVELKERYNLQDIRYEERNADRLEQPQDEIDIQAFIEEVVMKNIDPKNITLPLEYNYDA